MQNLLHIELYTYMRILHRGLFFRSRKSISLKINDFKYLKVQKINSLSKLTLTWCFWFSDLFNVFKGLIPFTRKG